MCIYLRHPFNETENGFSTPGTEGHKRAAAGGRFFYRLENEHIPPVCLFPDSRPTGESFPCRQS
ncbi:MAG: hypothetical protein DRH56_00840 [Deltaproteobacteria bacterium]|nr:MAG: hypothetical protein DRH56_00840 [Deltaproteobacteria bacterium]